MAFRETYNISDRWIRLEDIKLPPPAYSARTKTEDPEALTPHPQPRTANVAGSNDPMINSRVASWPFNLFLFMIFYGLLLAATLPVTADHGDQILIAFILAPSCVACIFGAMWAWYVAERDHGFSSRMRCIGNVSIVLEWTFSIAFLEKVAISFKGKPLMNCALYAFMIVPVIILILNLALIVPLLSCMNDTQRARRRREARATV